MSTEAASPHEDLSLYAIGDLAPLERQRFERHLAECEGCRREALALCSTVSVLDRAAPRYDMRPGLSYRVRRTLDFALGDPVLVTEADGPTESPPEEGAATSTPLLPREPWKRVAAAALVGTVATLAFFVGTQVAEASIVP